MITFLEENKSKSYYPGLGKAFLDILLKAQAPKYKIDKLDFIQIKPLCLKGHQGESEKATHKMGEYICKLYLIRDLYLGYTVFGRSRFTVVRMENHTIIKK